MWKAMLAGAAMIAIAGSSLVLAQQEQRAPGAEAPQQTERQRWRPTAEDASAFADARIAGLKAALRLTPEQDKLWPPVEAAMRDLAKQRFERMSAMRDAPRPADPIERLSRRADAMTAMGGSLKRLADAAGPLHQSLDESQKRRLAMVMRAGWNRMGGMGMGGHRHGWREGHMHGDRMGWREGRMRRHEREFGDGMMGPGMGRGMGPGMGHGMGRGMGRDMGPGMGPMQDGGRL